MCEQLLKAGAKPDKRDKGGSTALHLAAASQADNKVDVVKALLAGGADPFAKDDEGRSAHQLAEVASDSSKSDEKHSECVALIAKAQEKQAPRAEAKEAGENEQDEPSFKPSLDEFYQQLSSAFPQAKQADCEALPHRRADHCMLL